MVSLPSAQELALACGVAGAYVDVTDDLVTDSVRGTWGRSSSFSDTRPGMFSFDLVNDTGKYTPGNASSSLATTVRVGMGVSHIVDGMHFAGTIRSAEPYFTGPAGLSGSSKVRVTCDDMLGSAARTEMAELPESMILAGDPYLWWPLDEPVGSSSAFDRMSIGPDLVARTSATSTTFGTVPVSGYTATQLTVSVTSGGSAQFGTTTPIPAMPYAPGSMGSWGTWITVPGPSTGATMFVVYESFSFSFGVDLVTNSAFLRTTTPIAYGPSIEPRVPYYFSISLSQNTAAGTTTVYATPFVDGVPFSSPLSVYSYVGPALSNASATAVRVSLIVDNSGAGSASFSDLNHTSTKVNLQLASASTTFRRVAAIANAVPEIELEPSDYLSESPLVPASTDGQSALDALNDVVRTEQGYMWAETTGTLTSPVQIVKVRARDRGATIDAAHTFNITEIQNSPEFTTDIENMVSRATATGPTTSAQVTDPALVPYVGSASSSSRVLLRDYLDLRAWAEDRMIRGAATNVRVPSMALDALAINRWADVSALRPGDRVRIDGLPTTQLGVSQIDGWLIGCTYNLEYPSLHGEDRMLFTFYFQPVLPATAIYDSNDNRYMAGGSLPLDTSINSSTTSIVVALADGIPFTTSGSDLPVDIIVDSEEMTVTAAASPVGVLQTLTVTRGQNGTTAASHAANSEVDLAVPSLYAF